MTIYSDKWTGGGVEIDAVHNLKLRAEDPDDAVALSGILQSVKRYQAEKEDEAKRNAEHVLAAGKEGRP